MKIYVCDDKLQIMSVLSEKIKSLLPRNDLKSFLSGKELKKDKEDPICKTN